MLALRSARWIVCCFIALAAMGCTSSADFPSQPQGRSQGKGDGTADAGTLCKDDPTPIDAEAPIDAQAISEAPLDCASALAGEPIVIPLFRAGSRVSGVPNRPHTQTITATATVPRGCYSAIRARYHLVATCAGVAEQGHRWPSRCDPFDRTSYLAMADPGATPLLLIDAMTPFGADRIWEQDVTDYASALIGRHSYAINISTGATANGQGSGVCAGFDVDAELILVPGRPPRDVARVEPLFFDPHHGVFRGVTSAPITRSVTAPPGATAAQLHLYTTGHALNGPSHCDEFCLRTNVLTVDDRTFRITPWLDCTADTCTRDPLPAGIFKDCGDEIFTYQCRENPRSCPSSPPHARAGWCPGKKVERRDFDLGQSIATGTHTVHFSIPGAKGWFQVGAAIVYYR